MISKQFKGRKNRSNNLCNFLEKIGRIVSYFQTYDILKGKSQKRREAFMSFQIGELFNLEYWQQMFSGDLFSLNFW